MNNPHTLHYTGLEKYYFVAFWQLVIQANLQCVYFIIGNKRKFNSFFFFFVSTQVKLF